VGGKGGRGKGGGGGGWGGGGGAPGGGGGARFSAPVQTDPGAYSASYTMGTGSFPRVKRSGCGVYHILPSSAEVTDGVEIYLYFPSVPSWLIPGVNFTLRVSIHPKQNFAV